MSLHSSLLNNHLLLPFQYLSPASLSVSESSRIYILLHVKNPWKFSELAFLLTSDVLGPAAACTGCMRVKRAGAKSHI